MEIFLPRLIHIQSSQNVNHKRASIRCIKDQCQSAGKGHRTNRRDQLPQLCRLPNWEHVIPVSWGPQPETGTCSSDWPTSLCPPQSHSKKYSRASHISMHRSICSFTSQHDDSRKHQGKWQHIIPEIFTSQHGTHEKRGLYATVKLNMRPLYTWQNTVNSPSQTQSKFPRDCHITQMDLFPPFHRSDGSSSVKSLTKTDSLGLHWVGASESFPPPTRTQAFLPASHSHGPCFAQKPSSAPLLDST